MEFVKTWSGPTVWMYMLHASTLLRRVCVGLYEDETLTLSWHSISHWYYSGDTFVAMEAVQSAIWEI